MRIRPTYIKGRYCPNCGAQRLHVYDVLMLKRNHLRCDHCAVGFTDDAEGRWLAIKFSGTSAIKTMRQPYRIAVGQFKYNHPRNGSLLRRANCERARM